VIHSNKKLVLVFEYVEMDLKKFFAQFPKDKGMDPLLVKVPFFQANPPNFSHCSSSYSRALLPATSRKSCIGI
jgi:hypothetical protein